MQFKEYFVKGSIERQRFTLPACFFAFLKLAQKLSIVVADGGETKIEYEPFFLMLKELIEPLASNHPELCLRLYLELVLSADHCDEK